MQYVIIGAGAIGSTLAAFLARAGKDVTLIGRGDNLRAISDNGLTIRSVTEEDFVQPVRVMGADHYRGTPDVVIVCVKAYALDGIYSFLDRVCGTDTVVFSVLNALNMGDRIAAGMSTPATVVDGVAYVAVKVTAPGEVLKKLDFFRVVFGPRRGAPVVPRLETIKHDFVDAGITAEISTDMLKSTLQKFVRVSTLSAAEVFYDTDAGGIRESPESMDFLLQLGTEIAQIAEASGIPLAGDAVAAMKSDVLSVNPEYLTSLMYDVRNGHQAEFDTQFFDVYDLGRALGLPMRAYGTVSAKLGYAPAIAAQAAAGI